MSSALTSSRRTAGRRIAATGWGAALVCGFLAALQSASAQAQTQNQRGLRAAPPPLVIQRRSFLDPGKIAPRGSMHNYVGMDTWLREPVYWNQRGLLRLENLPQRFDPPGRPQPLFEF
jgi:hypothetical protein